MKLSERLQRIEDCIDNGLAVGQDLINEIQALEEKAANYDELTRILGTTNGQTLLKAANWDSLVKLIEEEGRDFDDHCVIATPMTVEEALNRIILKKETYHRDST